MPTINVDLLRQVLLEVDYSGWNPHVIAYREAEDRDGFRSITYGVEGHAIALAHPEALWHWHPDSDSSGLPLPGGDGAEFAVLVSVDGSRKKPGRNASHVARKLLGLDVAQAEQLFGAQSVEELRKFATELLELAEGVAP